MTTTSASMGGPLSEAERPEVLVEGSWFKVEDLPQILGNYMRSVSESNRQCKELSMKLRDSEDRLGVLEGQLATARERHQPIIGGVQIGRSVKQVMVCSTCFATQWPCEDARALGLDGGGSDER